MTESPEPSVMWRKDDRVVRITFAVYEYEASIMIGRPGAGGTDWVDLRQLESLRAAPPLALQAATPKLLEHVLRAAWSTYGLAVVGYLDGDSAEVRRALETAPVRSRAFEAARLVEDALSAYRDRRWRDAIDAFDAARTRYPETSFVDRHERKEAIARRRARADEQLRYEDGSIAGGAPSFARGRGDGLRNAAGLTASTSVSARTRLVGTSEWRIAGLSALRGQASP